VVNVDPEKESRRRKKKEVLFSVNSKKKKVIMKRPFKGGFLDIEKEGGGGVKKFKGSAF